MLCAKMDNQNNVERLNTLCSQELISQINNEIEMTKLIIEEKEQEYIDVQKEKKAREEYELLAKQINKYPEIDRIEHKIQEKKQANLEIIEEISNGILYELEIRREQVKLLENQLEEVRNWSKENLTS
uniref:Uncharacterized protein n=1 Tax=Euplotes harpa TaxID=151035 RepID=A0A7S3J6F3_9SPIT|mmetsp:Transcript_19414/g.22622  ORF Transcript_19414/g.22622 Transcript_19414/m.22622 type:complete len:128 (+) Transcript_19414:174-557(+)